MVTANCRKSGIEIGVHGELQGRLQPSIDGDRPVGVLIGHSRIKARQLPDMARQSILNLMDVIPVADDGMLDFLLRC